METNKKKRNLDEILSAAERIIKAREEELQEDLFGNTVSDKVLNEIKEILDSAATESHDPYKAYDLYYGIIKKLVLKAMPKSDIRDLVQLLACNLLTGVELLRKGERRGQDSRQQPNEKLDEVANIIMEWSEHPYDYMKLAQTLLDKCIEKGISPHERTLADFIPKR
jgi:hypothetical protein